MNAPMTEPLSRPLNASSKVRLFAVICLEPLKNKESSSTAVQQEEKDRECMAIRVDLAAGPASVAIALTGNNSGTAIGKQPQESSNARDN